jgi:Bacterial Ig-like domain (group 3)/FG-GAP-like repeat
MCRFSRRSFVFLVACICLLASNNRHLFASAQFEAPKYFSTGLVGDTGSSSIVMGDFNGDGRVDLAVGLGYGVKIFCGDGKGGFALCQFIALRGSASSMVAADFDHNGTPDLAVLIADYASQQAFVAILTPTGHGSFGSPRYYFIANNPYVAQLAAGDFWGNGKLDLAASVVGMPFSSDQPQSVAILKNDGTGKFKPAGSIPLGTSNTDFGLATASVSQRNKDDLVVAQDQQVEVFSAGPGGNFKRIASLNSTVNAVRPLVSVAAGDFNGDGNVDLVEVVGEGYFGITSYATVWLGDGGGHFHQGITLVGPALPANVGVADFNADGKVDLWITGENGVTIFIGKGNGEFLPPTNYAAGPVVSPIVIGDFDGDGKSDIAVTENAQSDDPVTFAILHGNGDGTFYAPENFPVENPVDVAVGDFNEDGSLDVAVAQQPLHSETGVRIFLGDGKGNLKLGQAIPGPVTSVVAGDFNLDGHQDLAVAGSPLAGGHGIVTILLGDGRGHFRAAQTYGVGPQPSFVRAGDFNGDGILDLVVTNAGDNTVSLLLGSGDGRFVSGSRVGVGLNPQFVAAGEILHGAGNDTHGRGNDVHERGNDLVVTNCGTGSCVPGQPTTGGSLSVLLNKGNGTFVKGSEIPLDSARIPVIEDFNLDGNGDMVIATNSGELLLFLGNGDGTFRAPVFLHSGFFVATADFNGDGKPDLVAEDEGQIVLLLGNGDGTFQPAITYLQLSCSGIGGGTGGGVGDFNGDGALDFIAAESCTTITRFLNSGGTRMSLSSPHRTVSAHQPIQLNATIAGSLEGAPLATGQVTFRDISIFPVRTLGTGQIKAGQAHLTASVGDPGVHTFEASYSGDKNFIPNTATASVQAQEGGSGEDGSSSNPGFGAGCSKQGPKSSPMRSAAAVKSSRVLRREGSATLTEDVENQVAYSGPETLKHSELRREERHEETAGNGEDLEKETSSGDATNIVSPNNPISGATVGFHGFDGLDAQDSRGAGHGNQSTTEPPDEAMAVGNGQVLQAINDAVAVYALNGKRLSGPKTTNAFFNLAPSVVHGPNGDNTYGPFVSDPNVLFDTDTQRWFVTAVRIATNSQTGEFVSKADVMVAVSKTSDATGGYDIYSIDITDAGFAQCPCASDQPLLGANRDGIYISANQYSLADGTFQSGLILALGKERLVAGQTPVSIGFQTLTQDGVPGFSIYPARTSHTSAMPAGVEYFMSTLDFSGVSGEEPLAGRGDHRITVWALGNTALLRTDDPDLLLQQVTINTEPYAIPPAATQKPGPTPLLDSLNAKGGQEILERLDANDDRMQQVFFADGKLYGAVNSRIGNPGNSSRVGIAWFEVEPKIAGCTLDAKMARQGYVAIADGNVMFPAIAVNEQGDGAIAFSVVGPTLFPSFGYVEIDAKGIGTGIHIATKGAAPEDGFSGYVSEGGDGIARWGDYSAAAVAPDGSIWLAGEYITGRPRAPQSLANWGTFIGALPPTQ